MSNTMQMMAMRDHGATYQEIADVFGVSKQCVHQRLKNVRQTQARIKCFQQDITFCSNRKCWRKTCKRHHSNADWSVKPYHSFADFTDTQYCPKKRGADNER